MLLIISVISHSVTNERIYTLPEITQNCHKSQLFKNTKYGMFTIMFYGNMVKITANWTQGIQKAQERVFSY